jgi:hypothetical protein
MVSANYIKGFGCFAILNAFSKRFKTVLKRGKKFVLYVFSRFYGAYRLSTTSYATDKRT